MAAKTHQIAFEIAGKLKGDFANTFKKASDAIKGFNGNLNNLNKQAATMDKVVKLRKEVGQSAREYTQAKMKVAELGKQISATKQPSQQMIAEFNKAKTATEKAKSSLEKKRDALKKVEDAAGTTGQSLKTLIDRQKQLEKSADRARIAQEKMAKATELQSKMKGWATSSAMALGGIAAAAAPVGLSVKQAMNFEDMQAELGKYSDESKEIFAGLTDLTKKYSKSAQDMTDMAAAAMQSGIAKTKEDVWTLVESQTQAAVAFGMTGDAVGSAWSDIQSKMQMNVKETQSVFDIVNKLGNETSASSEDVLNVLQRQGGTLKGLTALNTKQIAAMAGAFRSASTSSEVAATSMGTFVSRLTVGSAATKLQQKAFSALGLDAEDVAKKMTGSAESAQAVIQDVFARINKLSPDKRGAVIGRLFGNEAGIKAAVATLAANGDILGNNLEMVGDSANYAGSMFKEYMARANTTSEAMGVARNQITLISARIGQSLLPMVKSATQSFISIAEKVADFTSKNQDLVAKILKVTGVVVGLTAAFHATRLAVSLVGQPLLSVYKAYQWIASGALKAKAAVVAQKVAMIAQKAVMLASAAASKVAAAAQWVLNSAFWACPITWIVAGIAAVIAIGVLLYKNWDKVKAKTVELWQKFQEKFPAIAKIVQLAMVPIRIAIQVVINIFKLLKAAAIALWNGIKWCWNAIKSATVKAWNAVKDPIIKTWNKLKEFRNYVWGKFKSGFIGAFQTIRDKVGSIFGKLAGLVKSPMNAVIRVVNKAIGGINSIGFDLPEWAGGGHIGFNIPKIPQLAQGGIATGPTLAMIGEGREDEAVLPLSKLKSLMGGTGGGITVNFAPVINISGGGDAYADVKRGLDEGQRNLKRELQRLMRDQQRLSFA